MRRRELPSRMSLREHTITITLLEARTGPCEFQARVRRWDIDWTIATTCKAIIACTCAFSLYDARPMVSRIPALPSKSLVGADGSIASASLEQQFRVDSGCSDETIRYVSITRQDLNVLASCEKPVPGYGGVSILPTGLIDCPVHRVDATCADCLACLLACLPDRWDAAVGSSAQLSMTRAGLRTVAVATLNRSWHNRVERCMVIWR